MLNVQNSYENQRFLMVLLWCVMLLKHSVGKVFRLSLLPKAASFEGWCRRVVRLKSSPKAKYVEERCRVRRFQVRDRKTDWNASIDQRISWHNLQATTTRAAVANRISSDANCLVFETGTTDRPAAARFHLRASTTTATLHATATATATATLHVHN